MPQVNLVKEIIMEKSLEIILSLMVKAASKKREAKELKVKSLGKTKRYSLMHKLFSSTTLSRRRTHR
jgi:hypothetical protein